MKNLVDIKSRIDIIREDFSRFDTDERKEIKKNNKLIDDYVLELGEVKEVLFSLLKDRYKELIPVEDKNLSDYSEIDNTFVRVRYLSSNSFIFKMNIDENLYEVRYGNSLDKINDNIKSLVNKFLVVGVVLNKDDFKYSLSLYKYMVNFFEYKDKEEFNIKIKDTFDSLYWECPNFVNHIYLCFIQLLDKYKDKFEFYIKNKFTDTNGYDEELDNYYKLIVGYEESIQSSRFNSYQKFSNGELRVDDYLVDSTNRKEVISKFIDYDKYINFNDEESIHFYEQIKGIYHDLCEYMWISKFNYIITKIKEIYSNKGSYVNNYSTFIKNLKRLNKQRVSFNNKLFNIYNKMNDKNSKRYIKKYNNLFNKTNSKINEIISSYDNYDEIFFINDILNKINDDSTYYDCFKLMESNYGYLVNFMKDKDGSYDEYIEFLYNPYLNISKSIPFMSDVNIEDKLSEKYDLFDIDINLSDKSKLKEDLEYVIRLGYIDVYNIEIDKFKLAFDIKKLIGE